MIKRLKPFLLSLFIVVLDQYTKTWVIENIRQGQIYKKFFDDFLWIVHVRNTGAAFSIGAAQSDLVRFVIFVFLPIAMMFLLACAIFFKKSGLSTAQRWFAAGILGGGVGTIIDRIVRFDEGVVDFISVNFYGMLGMDRWPTFNVSDSCVVVFVILFALSVLFGRKTVETEDVVTVDSTDDDSYGENN